MRIDPDDLDDLSSLHSRVLVVLSKLGAWGSEPKLRQKMRADFDLFSSGADYSYRLSAAFDQSLIYLPLALEYLHELPSDKKDRSNDIEWTATGISFFISTYRAELGNAQLFDATIHAIVAVLRSWNQQFVVEKLAPDWTAVVGLSPVAIFLESLLNFDVPFKDSTLCQYLLHSWLSDTTNEENSANVINLFLFVRLSPNNWRICRNQMVLDAAFDPVLCDAHRSRAHSIIEVRCPDLYIEVMHQCFQGGQARLA